MRLRMMDLGAQIKQNSSLYASIIQLDGVHRRAQWRTRQPPDNKPQNLHVRTQNANQSLRRQGNNAESSLKNQQTIESSPLRPCT